MAVPEPAHLRFGPGLPAHPLTVGLRPVDPARWLELEGDVAPELAAKQAVLDEHHDEVVAALAEAEEGAAELLEAVLAFVLADARWAEVGGGVRTPTGGVVPLRGAHPVEVAARLVPDDLCLLDGDDHRLLAIAVAAPNRWRPAGKLGQDPSAVHGPVPGYDEALGAPVRRVLSALRPGRPRARRNWALLDDPALFQPESTPAPEGLSPEEAAHRLWLRVERQSLLRLERTGAVVFTIRTRQWPLHHLAAWPDAAAALRSALVGLPDDLARYKGVLDFREPVVSWLTEVGSAV